MSPGEAWLADAEGCAARLRAEEALLAAIGMDDPARAALEESAMELLRRVKGYQRGFSRAKRDLGEVASAVESHYLYGLSWDEVSGALGVSRTTLMRRRRAVAAWLDEHLVEL